MAQKRQDAHLENAGPGDLDDFSQRLARARGEEERDGSDGDRRTSDATELGKGLRIASELVAALLVGVGLGWGADRLIGAAPWGLLAGVGLGFGAGLLNVSRALNKLDDLDALDEEDKKVDAIKTPEDRPA